MADTPNPPPTPAGEPMPDLIKRTWSQPGGEAMALREARTGSDADSEGFDELVAAETPETTRHLSDPHIHSEEDTTKEGVDRATSVLGSDEQVGGENAGKNQGVGTEGRFSEKGR